MRILNPIPLASLVCAGHLLGGPLAFATPPDYLLIKRCAATMDERVPLRGHQWQISQPFVSIQLANGTGGWVARHTFEFDTYAFCNGPNGYAEYGTGDDVCMGRAADLPGLLAYSAPTTAPDAASGSFSLTESPNGNYTSNLNITATNNGSYNLAGYLGISLVYFEHHALVWSTNSDAGRVEISTDGGTTWVIVKTHTNYRGDRGQFKRVDINLSGYTGQTIRFRFRFTSDGSGFDDGWNIDDVRLLADGTSLFFDDFESGTGNWTLTGAWGLSVTNGYSSLGSIAPTGVYTTTPVIPPVSIAEGMGFAVMSASYTEANVTRNAYQAIYHTAPQFKAANELGYDNLCPNTGACVVNAVEPSAAPHRAVVLEQNKPNPFNPTTDISFVLPSDSPVSLRIYDENGRLVRTLLDETHFPAGEHGLSWNGLDAGGQPMHSGIYFYELRVNGQEHTRKMVLLK